MRRYLAAMIEQALWSLLNLGVNIALARLVAPETYGGFVFWANCGFVLSSLQNALTISHLNVLTPGRGDSPHRLETERIMHAATVLFLVLVGAVTLAITIGADGTSEFHTPAAALFLPAYLFQQYIRALAFSRGDAKGAAIQTGLVLILAAVLLSLAVAGHIPLNADGIMFLMATAYGVVGIGSAIRMCLSQMAGRPWPRLKDYLPFSRQSSWVFMGVTSAELLARLYTFVVAGMFGPAPLAALAATQLFMRPIPLVAQGWSMGGRVELLTKRDNGDWKGFMRWVWIALGGGAVMILFWAPAVDLAWPFISDKVFGGKYHEYRWMVLVWGFASAFMFAQVIISCAIQSLKAFKQLAIANATASVCATAMIIASAALWGYEAVLISTTLGLLVDVIVMLALLLSLIRRRRLAIHP